MYSDNIYDELDTLPFHFHALEKEMATHSSVLAWRIPGTGEPGGLPSNGVAQSWTRLKRLSSSSSRPKNKPLKQEGFKKYIWESKVISRNRKGHGVF